MQKLILAGAVVLSLILGAVVYQRLAANRAPGSGPEVTWEQLGALDYITGVAPDSLKALDGQEVKVPGFMVPLEDTQQNVVEFLLVPTPQACIHVPAPPSNQMVYIKMDDGVATAYGPIWVYGKLMLKSKKHMYGEASFEMQGRAIEPYR